MIVKNLKDMHRGWFIGNFEPSIIKTDLFEVALLTHYKNEDWPKHFHKEAYEVNLLISGTMQIHDTKLFPGDIFLIEKNEIVKPIFFEECKIVCIKSPSIPGDKYEVEK